MQTNKTKLWFPAKKYGWGWGLPCAWQGWVLMLAWLALLFGGGAFLAPHSIGLFAAYAIALSAVFFIIVLIKGERPRWRWGESKNNQSRLVTERLAELEELRRRQLISASEYESKRQEIFKQV